MRANITDQKFCYLAFSVLAKVPNSHLVEKKIEKVDKNVEILQRKVEISNYHLVSFNSYSLIFFSGGHIVTPNNGNIPNQNQAPDAMASAPLVSFPITIISSTTPSFTVFSSSMSTSTAVPTSKSSTPTTSNNDTVVIVAAPTVNPFPMSTGMAVTTNNNSSTDIGSVTTTISSTTKTFGNSTNMTDLVTPFRNVSISPTTLTANQTSLTTSQIVPSTVPSIHNSDPGNPTDLFSVLSKINTTLLTSALSSIFINSFTGPIFGFEVPNINIFIDTRKNRDDPAVILNISDGLSFTTKKTVIKKSVSERDTEPLTDRSVTENVDLSAPGRGNNFGQSATTTIRSSLPIIYGSITRQSEMSSNSKRVSYFLCCFRM